MKKIKTKYKLDDISKKTAKELTGENILKLVKKDLELLRKFRI